MPFRPTLSGPSSTSRKVFTRYSSQSPLLVIDGQQRLTTVSLILEALARQLGDNEPVDGFSAKKLRNYYLLNPLEEGERGFKLLLTQTDKASLLALVQQKAQPTDQSLRVTENFAFFEEQVQKLGSDLPRTLPRPRETGRGRHRAQSRPRQSSASSLRA